MTPMRPRGVWSASGVCVVLSRGWFQPPIHVLPSRHRKANMAMLNKNSEKQWGMSVFKNRKCEHVKVNPPKIYRLLGENKTGFLLRDTHMDAASPTCLLCPHTHPVPAITCPGHNGFFPDGLLFPPASCESLPLPTTHMPFICQNTSTCVLKLGFNFSYKPH